MNENDDIGPVPEDESQKEDSNDGPVETLINTFNSSLMLALPSQNLQLAEENYTRAYAIFQFIKSNFSDDADPDELIYLDFADLLFLQIALVKTLLRNSGFMIEKRLEKSRECLDQIRDYCEKSMALFYKLSRSEIKDNADLGFMLNICALNAKFFMHLCDSQTIDVDLTAKLDENKYVDEVEERKKALEKLKKYFEEPWEDYNNEVYHLHAALIKKIIDAQERRLEVIKNELNKVTYYRPKGNEVFIVHGHDEAILSELRQMLKETFYLNPIVLRDESDDGLTIIEKFEKYAIKSSFVFVILTPDDFLSKSGGDYYQGRPNVLFELGWFFGRLGRDRVRILKKKNTALPSDLAGIATLDFNEKIEEIFRKINSSLEDSGVIERD